MPVKMSSSRKTSPNSLSICGRASRQASPTVTGLPSTARLVTIVSSAVATTVATMVTTKTMPAPNRESAMARLSSAGVAFGSLSTWLVPSEVERCARMVTTSVMTATTREMPRTVRQ